MSTALVRWQDTPRLYLVEASDPKREGIPARTGWLDIGRQHSNAALDAAVTDYGTRTGYSVVGMFPHTHLPKPKAAKSKSTRIPATL